MSRKKSLSDQLDQMTCECLAVRVRLLNRVVTTIYDDALRPFGLRVSQGNILVAIARLGPISPTRICRVLRLEKSTLSRDVERMKTNGWVEQSAVEGKSKLLQLTADGTALLRSIQPVWEKAQLQTRELLGEEGEASIHLLARRLGFVGERNWKGK